MRSSAAVKEQRRARVRDPESTREAILAAARAMMAEAGPDGLTVSDVARRAGVNRGTAYQHFPSRDEMVGAVLERVGRATKAVLDSNPSPNLNDRIDETVRYFVTHPELVRLSVFRLLAGVPHPSADLWEDYVSRVRQLVGAPAGAAAVDGEMLAVILLGATMLWSLRVQSGGARMSDTERYLRELKRLMLHGVLDPARHGDLAAAAGVKPRRRAANPNHGRKADRGAHS